jgi:hypothetical protein
VHAHGGLAVARDGCREDMTPIQWIFMATDGTGVCCRHRMVARDHRIDASALR